MTKVITVRHPFERIVSAFRQRMEARSPIGGGQNYVVNIFGKKILAYRQQYLKKFGQESLSKENNYGAIGQVSY